MIININQLQSQKQTQTNLLSSQSFLTKNKITINNPTQTHYTVQGVQIYTPSQIKALKDAQQKCKSNTNKQCIQVKTYQTDDYFQQFEQIKQSTNPKQRVQQLLKSKYSKDLAKTHIVDRMQASSYINTMKNTTDNKNIQFLTKNKDDSNSIKQRLAKNNIALSRLQKQRNKKDAIQKKLQQLTKHYKQYFNTQQKQQKSKLKQNKDHFNHQEVEYINDEQDRQEYGGKEDQQSQLQIQNTTNKNNKKKNNNNIKSTTNSNSKASSSKCSTKPTITGKQYTSKSNKNNKQQESEFVQIQQQQGIEDKGKNLDNVSTTSNRSTAYTQKLGSAVYSLFL